MASAGRALPVAGSTSSIARCERDARGGGVCFGVYISGWGRMDMEMEGDSHRGGVGVNAADGGPADSCRSAQHDIVVSHWSAIRLLLVMSMHRISLYYLSEYDCQGGIYKPQSTRYSHLHWASSSDKDL